MASIRKRLSRALGLNAEASPLTSKATNIDGNRHSFDSGYHSMIAEPKCGSQGCLSQTTTFVNPDTESSLNRSPRKLHKAISTTFSGAMQAFSDTVRSTTSYIYPTAGEPELPSSEWAECETPKKQSRRSSIMSSVRSRTQLFTPRARHHRNESQELPNSPVPSTYEKAPALDVDIPNPSFSYESLRRSSTSRGSQLLAGVKLPATAGKLWPGPTRMTVDQALGNNRRAILHAGSSTFDDPYVEHGDGFQHGLSFITSASEFTLTTSSPEANNRYLSDEKGYLSEAESNADVSEPDGLAPACLKYVAPGSPEARTSSPCRHKDPAESRVHVASSASTCQKTTPSPMYSSLPLRPKPSKSDTLDGTAKQTALLHPPSRRSSHRFASLEDGINALFPPYEDAMTLKSSSLYKQQSSDVYDADAESLESSMGSRAAWKRHRADRERRYMEIIDMAPATESDEEVGPELELERSPSKKSVHYAEELFLDTVNNEGSESTPRYPTGALRYAVEAIERPAFPVGDFAYAVEAIERPSVTTFDPLETVFQQRPMLRLSDKIDEQEPLQVSDPQDWSPSRKEAPSPLPADQSPSRVELPSSPESSPVDLPAAPKYTMTMMELTDEELKTFGAGNLDGQSICQFSSESTDVSACFSPGQQSHVAPEDAYEAGLRAERLFVPTYMSRSSRTRAVGEDASEAGLQTTGTSMPIYPSDVLQARPAMDNVFEGDLKADHLFAPIFNATSQGTQRERLEARSVMPKPRSRNGTPFEPIRTVSGLSDDTDDSCSITTQSPSCNAPPPFPSLHVQSKPARRISSAIDSLATHGNEQIRLTGPAKSGIDSSLPSRFDGPRDQTNRAESRIFSLKASERASSPDDYDQAAFLEQHDFQSPSTGTRSSIRSPSNTNTPQKTSNAAQLPSFGSPSPIASRKARRKQKKSSSRMETLACADFTVNPRNITSGPDFSPSKHKLKKSSPLEKTQTPLSESAKITGSSVQKPSVDRQIGWKNRPGRDHTSLEEFTGTDGANVMLLDRASKSKSSKRRCSGKRQAAATLLITSSPPRMKIPRVRREPSSGETHEYARGYAKDSKSHFEPESSIESVDSMSDSPPLYINRRLGSTSFAGYELDRVRQASPSVYSRHEMDEDLQQDSDVETLDTVSGDVTIGNHREPDKNASRAPGQEKNGKPPPEVQKKFAVQRELERKSDRACSRLVDKLKSGAPGDDHVRRDDPAQKEARPPWRS